MAVAKTIVMNEIKLILPHQGERVSTYIVKANSNI